MKTDKTSVYGGDRIRHRRAELQIPRQYKFDRHNQGDGLKLLGDIAAEIAGVAFFDPQYRGVLDKLQYGNEGKGRQAGRVALTQMDPETIAEFLHGLDRALRPSGHLFLWMDKFHLCEGVRDWLDGTSLSMVDLIVWNKDRIGSGYRSRRTSEYLMALQKEPKRAKGEWMDHGIPDVWTEKIDRKTHPHCKPVGLQQRLIESVTGEDELVLDPAAGSFSVMEAALRAGRKFLGTDIAKPPAASGRHPRRGMGASHSSGKQDSDAQEMTELPVFAKRSSAR